ncbi:MAG: hypothetical protein HYV63_14410 [Candidatus Schekmanbacteria bacterium]|nr:hypothetical protein [Candidatus Schekmanbacteria bacterium]
MSLPTNRRTAAFCRWSDPPASDQVRARREPHSSAAAVSVLLILAWAAVAGAGPENPHSVPLPVIVSLRAEYLAYSFDLLAAYAERNLEGEVAAAEPTAAGGELARFSAESGTVDATRWRLDLYGKVAWKRPPEPDLTFDQMVVDLKSGAATGWRYGKRLDKIEFEAFQAGIQATAENEGAARRRAPQAPGQRLGYLQVEGSFAMVTATSLAIQVGGEINATDATVWVEGTPMTTLDRFRFRSTEAAQLRGWGLEGLRLSTASGLYLGGAYGIGRRHAGTEGRLRFRYEEYGFLGARVGDDRKLGLGGDWHLVTVPPGELRLILDADTAQDRQLSARLTQSWSGPRSGSVNVEFGSLRQGGRDDPVYLLVEQNSAWPGGGSDYLSLRATSQERTLWRTDWRVPLGRVAHVYLRGDGQTDPGDADGRGRVRRGRGELGVSFAIGPLDLVPGVSYERDGAQQRTVQQPVLASEWRPPALAGGATLLVTERLALRRERSSGGAQPVRQTWQSDLGWELRLSPVALTHRLAVRLGARAAHLWRSAASSYLTYGDTAELRFRPRLDSAAELGLAIVWEGQRDGRRPHLSAGDTRRIARLLAHLPAPVSAPQSGLAPPTRDVTAWATFDFDLDASTPIAVELFGSVPFAAVWSVAVEGGYQFQYSSWRNGALSISRDIRRAELRWTWRPFTQEVLFEVVPKLWWGL